MERFLCVRGIAAAMPTANIDTDVIMPKQFLKGIDRSGLARGLFHDLRFDETGEPRPDFILNRSGMADCRFLLVGPNFGCGSSREHAVWGMLQYGIRAVIGTSFAGIFADNAANNGLLLISLDPQDLNRLFAAIADGQPEIEVNLEQQTISAGGLLIHFPIEAARRTALLKGLDRIGETLQHATLIRAFEAGYFAENPWLNEENAA
ncbi:3-isopropylmalate dehydratase small subunit [Beijerinckia indica]|uniref:3-isopropylmalate dehydratase small subunit n=1 Tax=Beijerinckia indica subsp. indica (strain ATCC 9039 / DSM 1715 / NCIMB 8712) TaxID=395963 RepID=B2IES5_BEII9|nr:3-isopropylmalate dehydratase small subunit [Beijerinckia indica]ACB97015.1 3-isopropylmalate dehydratase, small subunit [Beijerinckia indica subsp. indica ATCC 9039]